MLRSMYASITIAAQFFVCLAMVLAVCSTPGCRVSSNANTAQKPLGTVRFAVEPAFAELEIDEKRLGPAKMFEKRGVLLKPGTHRVIVEAEGYFTEYRLFEVVGDELTVVEVSLRPIPN